MTILFKQARRGGASLTDFEAVSIMLEARSVQNDVVKLGPGGLGRRIYIGGAYMDFDANGNLEDVDSRHP